jgi:hypothetical protein
LEVRWDSFLCDCRIGVDFGPEKWNFLVLPKWGESTMDNLPDTGGVKGHR